MKRELILGLTLLPRDRPAWLVFIGGQGFVSPRQGPIRTDSFGWLRHHVCHLTRFCQSGEDQSEPTTLVGLCMRVSFNINFNSQMVAISPQNLFMSVLDPLERTKKKKTQGNQSMRNSLRINPSHLPKPSSHSVC